MVQLSSKKAFKSAVLVTAALGASGVQGAAIPAGQGSSSVATLDVDASVLNIPNAMPQKTFSAPQGDGKRIWRGRLGRRGPWRNDPVEPVRHDLINLDLSNGPHNHHGDLINVETIAKRRHDHDDDVVVVRPHHGGHHGSHDDVEVHEHIHDHDKRRHDDVVDYGDRYRGDHYRHGGHRYDYYDDGYYGHGNSHIHEHYHGHSHGGHYKRHHGDDVVIVDGHRHHGHNGHHGHSHHGHNDNAHVHEHIHEHIHDRDQGVEKRRHGDDVVIIDDDRHHRHHGHHGHQDHDDVHVHEHIHDKKHHDTTVISGGRHGTTVVEGSRDGTTVVAGSRHDTTVVKGSRHGTTVVKGSRHGTTIVDAGRHRHHDDVTVVARAKSNTSVSSGGRGGEVQMDGDKHKPEITLGKRRSERIVVVDQRHPWHDTDMYYRYPSTHSSFGRPMYFGRGNGYNRIHMVDGPYVGSVRYSSHWRSGNSWYKRSHDDDDRHDRHGGHRHHDHHGHHGHDSHDDVTVVTKRDGAIDMGGAPGYIDVTSPVSNSTTAARIASLVLSTTNGTETNSSFVLNASNNIRTQVYLVPADASSTNATAEAAQPAKSSGPIRVNLKLPIFVAQTAKVEPYCATFDPAPSNPGPLFVTKCMDEGSDPHSSQLFSYDPATGIIHPDWKPSPEAQSILAAMPDSVDGDDNMVTASATDDDDVEPSAVSAMSAKASSAPPPLTTTGPKTSTDSTAIDSKASNVTLIFTPVNPTVQTNTAFDDAEDQDAFSTASADDASMVPGSTDSSTEEAMPQQAGTMGTRDYGYPSEYPGEAYPAYQYGPSYDSYDGSAYGSYPGDYEEERPNYTAPYDWRWTKSSDDSMASAPAGTFA